MDVVVFIALAAINVAAFIVYGIDKLKAGRGQWRISETALLMIALLGGSIGAWAGMNLWHHKTQHWKFKYGIPLVAVVHIAVCVALLRPVMW